MEMAQAISVIVADSSEDFRRMLSERIDAEEDMQVVAAVENGKEAARMVIALRPDVLITDLLLREMEGIGLIDHLRQRRMLPHTVVVSGFFTDRLAERAGELGVERFLPKPCRVSALIEWIREAASADSEAKAGEELFFRQRRREAEKLADEVLKASDVYTHLWGCSYLREALIRIAGDPEKLLGVTKVLYPELAEHFATSADSIERCIRNALTIAWRNGNAGVRREAFAAVGLECPEKRPGNVKFMKLAAEYMNRRRENR